MDLAALPPRVRSFYQLIEKWPSHQQQQAVHIFKQLSQLMDPDDAAENFLDQWPDGPASLQDNEAALQRLFSHVQEMFGIDVAQPPAPQPAATPATAAVPGRQEAAPAAPQHSQPTPGGQETHVAHAALATAVHAAAGQWPGSPQPPSGLQGAAAAAAAAAASQPAAAAPAVAGWCVRPLDSQPTGSSAEQTASSMDVDIMSAGTCYSATPAAPAASSCSIASFDAAAARLAAAAAATSANTAASIAGSTPSQLMKMLMEEQKRRRAEQARKAKEMKQVNKQLLQAVKQIEELEGQLAAQGMDLQDIDLDSISEQQLLEELQQQELQEQELLQQEAAADAELKVRQDRYRQLQEQDRKEDARLISELSDLMTDLMS